MISMITRITFIIFLYCISINSFASIDEKRNSNPIDTAVYIDPVQVTSIKQGLQLRGEAVSASIITRNIIQKNGITDLKGASQIVPNFYMPDYGSRTTSSIYVRGLGARIDHPVVGLNIDNVPIMNKDNFDFEMADIERIEVIKGPQSAMYGRNTMGGVINIYTISPLNYQGTRLGLEYGSGNSIKARASFYDKINSKFGYSITGYYNQTDGFYTNDYSGEKADWEKIGGGRLKFQWRNKNGLSIDNTISFSMLNQGGYPYQSVESGKISYNDISAFERTNMTNGLTIGKSYDNFTLSSITSYQYSDNDLKLDNDFTPLNYFTLNQMVNEHTITQDFIVKSKGKKSYNWLFGAFAFSESTTLNGPVLFKEDGINNLILKNANEHDPQYIYEWLDETLLLESNFKIPTKGASIYHKSEYASGKWRLSAELRLDYEHTQLKYNNYTNTNYRATNKYDDSKIYDINITIDNNEVIKQTFTELLPKLSAIYDLGERGSLYGTISKGYKAGGFNTQMFSDVLQQQLMKEMGVGKSYNVADIITYDPEYSWNYEVGGNLAWKDAGIRANFALFYIDCIDQQLTVFPEGSTTGRLMTNAGRSRSIGGEFSIRAAVTSKLNLYADYGYTNAKFVDYNNGKEDFSGNYVPYAPQHTLSVRGDYTFYLNSTFIDRITLNGGVRGIGEIYWEENNTIKQPFYALIDASISFSTKRYSLDLWGRNLANTSYDTFYFESIGNRFVQKGRPQTFGITLNININ